MSNATYAFVFTGNSNWKFSSDDDWLWEVLELDGSEKVLGHRNIDGAICKVLKTADDKLVAITH